MQTCTETVSLITPSLLGLRSTAVPPVARTTQLRPGASSGRELSAVDSAQPRQQGRGSSGSSTQKAAGSERQAR